MTTDQENHIAVALHRAAGSITADPGLPRRAAAGGARRRRRRAGLGVAAIGAVALAAASVTLLGTAPGQGNLSPANGTADGGGSSDAYGRYLTAPTRGDLAQDAGYIDRAIEAWNGSHKASANADRGLFDHLIGDPHVVWAGRTPAGPAAAIAQQADLLEHGNLAPEDVGRRTLLGFVGVDSKGNPRVIADDYAPKGGMPVAGWLVNPERSVLVALDRGEPVGVTTGWTYHPDGRREMTYRTLAFTDGAAVVDLGKPAEASGLQLSRLPQRSGADLLGVAGGVPFSTSDDTRLMWTSHSASGGRLRLQIAGTSPGATDPAEDFEKALAERLTGIPDATAFSLWHATGVLADGTAITIGEQRLDHDPSHVFAVLTAPSGTTEAIDAGPIDRHATLPVVVRLPGSRGIVLAAYGSNLSWRGSAGEAWSAEAANAALADPDATQVRVTRTGQPAVLINLGRTH